MKKLLYVIITLFIFGLGSLFGMWFARPAYTPPVSTIQHPTGAEVLTELQAYRESQGLPAFEVSEILCDNIAERWVNYNKTGSHAGFKEFMEREYPPGFQAAEILVAGESAKQMVDKWKNSPSHDLFIHKYSKICVYSSNGSTVAILSD